MLRRTVRLWGIGRGKKIGNLEGGAEENGRDGEQGLFHRVESIGFQKEKTIGVENDRNGRGRL